MAEHYCPHCGEMHGGEEVVEELAAEDEPEAAVEVAAIEALEHVAVAALETVAEITREEEETERVEAIMEAVEEVAEDEPGEPEPDPEPEVEEEVEEAAAEPIAVAPPAREEDTPQGKEGEGKKVSAFAKRHRR